MILRPAGRVDKRLAERGALMSVQQHRAIPRLVSLILLWCGLCLPLLAEQGDVLLPLVAGEDEHEDESPSPGWRRYTIGNAVAEVQISDFRASVGSFALRRHHPVPIPTWRGGRGHETDTEASLTVLDLFNTNDPALGFSTDMHNYVGHLQLIDEGGPQEGPWQLVEQADDRVVLQAEDPERGMLWRMSYRMAPDQGEATRPTLHCRLEVEYSGEDSLETFPYLFAINGVHQDDPRNEAYHSAIFIHSDRSTFNYHRLPGHAQNHVFTLPGHEDAVMPASRVDYIGMKSRYFGALWTPGQVRVEQIDPEEPGSTRPGRSLVDLVEGGPVVADGERDYSLNVLARGYVRDRLGQAERQAVLIAKLLAPGGANWRLESGQRLSAEWSITVVGMTKADLALLEPHETEIQNTDAFYNFFKILVRLLSAILGVFHAVTGNYGVSLIMLVILVKLALHRTNVKQQTSMVKMQKLAPELKRIQEQHKNDRQAAAMKQMELFRKHQVHPMAGCLPIFIQMPIFIALYQTLSHSAEMRGDSLLWLRDLTLPDQTFFLGFQLPWIGDATINLLPITYMCISLWMSLQAKMPDNAGDQQRQMFMMMRWLPVIFGLIFYNMPSGLVLYFTCSALIGTLEMKYIRKKIGGIGTPMM